MGELKLYIRVTLNGAGSYVETGDCRLSDLVQDKDDSYTIEGIMLTEEEYNSLPEFNGF